MKKNKPIYLHFCRFLHTKPSLYILHKTIFLTIDCMESLLI